MRVVVMDGRLYGEIYRDVYETHRYPEHLMHKFNGFGVSSKVLFDLYDKGVRKIRFFYHTPVLTIHVYEVPIEKLMGSSYIYEYHGDVQYFLPLEEMNELI